MRIVKAFAVSLGIVAVMVALAWKLLVPRAIEHDLRERLDAAGYAQARFELAEVALDRVELRDVTLGQGLDLGRVDIAAGPYQLWRGQRADITVSGSRIATGAVRSGAAGAKLPFDRVTVRDAELIGEHERVAISGTIDLTKSAFDLVATAEVPQATWNGIAVEAATIRAALAGDVSGFTARGELRARDVTTKSARAHELRLPFDLAVSLGDGVTIRSQDEVAVTAKSAAVVVGGSAISVDDPVVVARGATRVGGVKLAFAHGRDFELAAVLDHVPVDRVLAAATRDRVRGSGVLDGQLVLNDRLAITKGIFRARGPGRLFASEPVKLETDGFKIQNRVAAALSDFDYSRLVMTIDSDVHLSLAGRGHTVPQELAIDVNVRGVLAQNERTR